MKGLGQPGSVQTGFGVPTLQVNNPSATTGPTPEAVAQDSGADVDPVTFFGEDVPTLLWDSATKQYYINPEKTSAKFQWETGQLNNTFPFTIPGNQTIQFNVRINPETGMRGDTEIGAFMLTSSGRLACQPYIPLLDKNLSNGLISTNLMFGTAQLQAVLAQTIYSLPSFDWQVTAMDTSGTNNTVSPVFFSRRFLDSGVARLKASRRAIGMGRFMHAYWLGPTTAFDQTSSAAIVPTPTVVIPPLHTVTVTYSVPSDAYFDCRWILDDSDLSGSAVGANLLAQILEGGSGRALVDVPTSTQGISWQDFLAVPTSAVSGFPSGGGALATGGVRAASLPGPAGCWSHLFSPGCDITVVFTNVNGSSNVNLRSAFAGVLIYVDPSTGACP